MYPKPLIVVATESEIAPSIPFLMEHKIPYIITGVGMLATTHALTKALYSCTPSYVLNIGIAGSFSRHLAIGSVIEVVQDTFSELGAEDENGFITIDELGFGISSWPNQSKDGIRTNLAQVDAITVNKVHGNILSIESIRRRLPEVQVESMEGAAIFYVCHKENVPCMQVRSISNYVEIRDKSAWDIPLAVQNLNRWLANFLISYPTSFLR